MIKRSKYSCIILVLCEYYFSTFLNTGYKILFDRILNFTSQKLFLGHDATTKHNNLWIDHIANIGNSLSQGFLPFDQWHDYKSYLLFWLPRRYGIHPTYLQNLLSTGILFYLNAGCPKRLKITAIHVHIPNLTCTVTKTMKYLPI